MEKFLCTFKLSKGSIIIGWLKLALNALCILLFLVALTFSSILFEAFKKIVSGNEEIGKTSKFNEINSWNFIKFFSITLSELYIYIVLFILLFIAYGTFSFVLIIGSINVS